MSTDRHHIVVGVVPASTKRVVAAAIVFARRFDADLVIASVDPHRRTVEERPDGTVLGVVSDTTFVDVDEVVFDPDQLTLCHEVLDSSGVTWTTRALAGDPAIELDALAERLDASMVIVGTREPGVRETLREFVNGSVAMRLSHRQNRPIVVIPLAPTGPDGAMPWAGDD
ncbi:nucleotide-binding universal stress UspA family protein [Pseudoclavibacter chungangensis]|nr:universal stress protein [Pseudoclavibacter chungangensis]NYJ65299.1 nucleotide-binding universal stress UspA family protein [Pseudoclavibacter chungangensis]